MPDEPKPESMSEAYLKNIARDIQQIKTTLHEVTNYMHDAESEVPEKMRRFIMYFHDVHDIQNLYHVAGIEVPPHVVREVERCADRFRHIVEDLERSGETFEKVRRDMANRPGNRYDHTKLLAKETQGEDNQRTVGAESGAEAKGG